MFLGAVAAGSTIWCTHFVSMLAYQPGVPVTYQPDLTALSLVIAIVGSGAGLALGSRHFIAAPVLGGAAFGVGITAMHYTGMAAYLVDGLVQWHMDYVAASIIFASSFSAAAFYVAARSQHMLRQHAVSGLIVLGIVSLHFTAMGALAITPLAPPEGALTSEDASNVLAFAVAGVCLLVLGAGAVAHLLDSDAQDHAAARLRHMAESTVDGMVIEQGGHIVEVNAAFEALVNAQRSSLLERSFSSYLEGQVRIEENLLVQTSLRAQGGDVLPVEVIARQERSRPDEAGIVVYAVRDLRPRLAQERRIAQLARNDSLTGLPNRTSFLERLGNAIEVSRDNERIALLVIDLNRFKEVNDLHGHAAGDRVLCVLANRMTEVLDEGDYLARLGGDEFVAMTRIGRRREALDRAARLEAQLFAPVPIDQAEVTCGGSIGIAIYPDDATTPTALMNNADLAMYRAKASLGDSTCFYEQDMDEIVRMRRKTVQDLREALERDEFELHYQVQVSVTTGEPTGYEVLLRWKHPERGYVAPMDFIPLAEETGLILPIGEWVLRTACAEAASWSTPYRIAVNLSPVQLAHTDLPGLVHHTLLDSGMSPSRLELEITETSLIADRDRTMHILRQLKALGVSVAMDDFGTGYSSLSTLKAFPFDKIKLDKSFMHEIEHSAQARAMIRAVLALGESLHIPILAEGVETTDQLDFLRDEGCNEAQGYLLGRPARKIGPPAAVKTRKSA